MIDYKMKYQATIFADLEKITATNSNITLMLECFKDKEFLPVIFQEISQSTSVITPRIQLAPHDGEWLIFLGSNNIIIEQRPTDLQGTNLGTVRDFSLIATEYANRIINAFKLRSPRLSLISAYLLEEMMEDKLKSIFNKFLIPLRTYQEIPPYEWNARAVSRLPITINGKDESLNAIAMVNRLRGETTDLKAGAITFDRIQISFDINTDQNAKEARFTSENLAEFFEKSIAVHDDLLGQIEGVING